MKFNFGHGLLLVLLSFMAGMSYLVYRCTLQPIGLVNPEYYAQELKYTDQMNKVRNAMALGEAVDIDYNASSQEVIIKYPLMNDEISGEILFFKPDNNGFDFSIAVNHNTNNLQKINTSKLPHGKWRVKINWEAKGTSYYNEEEIFIN